MFERAHFLVVYVGSAAMVAFLAACLTSPQVATFTCQTSAADGTETCELAETLAAIAPEAGGITLEALVPERAAQEPAPDAAALRRPTQ